MEERMNYIIDSSIMLNLFITENKQEFAQVRQFISENITNSYSLDFLKLEVTNVLAKRISSPDLFEKYLRDFQNLSIKYFTLEDSYLEIAKNIAREFNTSVYDAVYHSLAIHKSMTFVTLDSKYFVKTQSIGSIELIS